MGIQSTREIRRWQAIERIELIYKLAIDFDYREIEDESCEDDYDVEDFVDKFNLTQDKIDNINKWSNSMLEKYMDKPFFRYSMFDNYDVIDNEEEY